MSESGSINTADVKYDYNTSEKNNYTTRPSTFSGSSTKFK